MLCESCHMDKGISFPPSPPTFPSQKLHCRSNLVIRSGYSIVNPSIVIVISMAVFKEYEKYLTIDRLFFMEGW